MAEFHVTILATIEADQKSDHSPRDPSGADPDPHLPICLGPQINALDSLWRSSRPWRSQHRFDRWTTNRLWRGVQGRIQGKANNVERFATKRLAHFDETAPLRIKYTEIDEALDAFDSVMAKYSKLFRLDWQLGIAFDQLFPDWKEVFEIRWKRRRPTRPADRIVPAAL